MFHRGAHAALRRPTTIVTAVVALGGAAPSAAHAASAPPPPASTANCYGSLTRATPTVDDPNLLDYQFHCDTRITAYTILVNRYKNNAGTIDDFSSTPSVFEPDRVTPDTNTTWTCEGSIPGNGFNCNTGGGTSFMGAWSWSEGSLDVTDPYCGLPATTAGKKTTPAEAPALVQLVVSDVTGAEDGPFTLWPTAACPKPKKQTTKPKKQSKHHGARKSTVRPLASRTH